MPVSGIAWAAAAGSRPGFDPPTFVPQMERVSESTLRFLGIGRVRKRTMRSIAYTFSAAGGFSQIVWLYDRGVP